MADSRDIERIYVQIVLDTPKTASTVKLTPELDALWDQIAGEVAEMRRQGLGFDIPAEIPDVVIAAKVEDPPG